MSLTTVKTRTPRPEACISCGRKLLTAKHRGPVPPGTARYGGYGNCSTCYQRNGQGAARTPGPAPTGLQRVPGATDGQVRSFALRMCSLAADAEQARVVLRTAGVIA